MASFKLTHKAGHPLKIKSIDLVLSQSCDPFEGVFGRLSSSMDDEENDFGNNFDDLVEINVQRLKTPEELKKYPEVEYLSGLPETQFRSVEIEGRRILNAESSGGLVIGNEGKSMRLSVEFYIPTHILNMRVTGQHLIKLKVFHYAPKTPHVTFSLNGKEDA